MRFLAISRWSVLDKAYLGRSSNMSSGILNVLFREDTNTGAMKTSCYQPRRMVAIAAVSDETRNVVPSSTASTDPPSSNVRTTVEADEGNLCYSKYGTPEEILASNPTKAREVWLKVEDQVRSNKVLVYGRRRCSYSAKALAALKAAGCKENDITLITIEDSPEEVPYFLAALSRLSGGKPTTAKVFVKGKFVGGGNKCERLLKAGVLEKVLHGQFDAKDVEEKF